MVKGTCSLWAYSEAAFFWGCLSLCVREALERDSDLFSFFQRVRVRMGCLRRIGSGDFCRVAAVLML